MAELLHQLNQFGDWYQSTLSNLDGVSIFTRFPMRFFMEADRYDRLSIRHLTLPAHPHIIVGVAHLRSKLYLSDRDQADLANRCVRVIEKTERDAGHSRSILFGDFNMNPFEEGMSGSESFHAVMDQKTASRQYRTVFGERRQFFYNPMWSRMGDLTTGPPGTYYYGNSGILTYFWNTFDQVLVRPSLMDRFVADRLEVVTDIGDDSLLRPESGRPDDRMASDHLPLLFSLDLPLEA